MLLQLRSKMYPSIKANFKSIYGKDKSCPLLCGLNHIDSQENLLVCPKLKSNNNKATHADLFKSTEVQLQAVKIFSSILEKRKTLLEKIENCIT